MGSFACWQISQLDTNWSTSTVILWHKYFSLMRCNVIAVPLCPAKQCAWAALNSSYCKETAPLVRKTSPHLLEVQNGVKFHLLCGSGVFFYPLLHVESCFDRSIAVCNGNKNLCSAQYGARYCSRLVRRWRRVGQGCRLQLYWECRQLRFSLQANNPVESCILPFVPAIIGGFACEFCLDWPWACDRISPQTGATMVNVKVFACGGCGALF